VVDGGVTFGAGMHPIDREHLAGAGKEVTIGVRPEDLSITPDGQGLTVTVEVVEELGADAYIYGSTTQTAGEIKPIIARVDGRRPPEKGAVVNLSPRVGHMHVFNADTGQRIGD